MNFKSFTVIPDTPEPLKPLEEMAYNLYFSWHPEVMNLFRKLVSDGDSETAVTNPIKVLAEAPQEILEEKSKDSEFIANVNNIYEHFQQYISAKTWYDSAWQKTDKTKIAYFSLEFGLHECLPIYSGGLGVLAGDHMKTISDLGIPAVGVGLLYRHGYFQQKINAEGMQQEIFPENDLHNMPVNLIKNERDEPLTDAITIGHEKVHYQIWEVCVGRARILLLDTNLPENPDHLRIITNALYDSNRDTRIKQEILLGMGGYKALKTLDYEIEGYHLNEGHSAFLVFERILNLVNERGFTMQEAKEMVWATTLFTTHTPVPAGNERFTVDLVDRYLHKVADEMKMDWNAFLAMGRENPNDSQEEFCLTVLALKTCAFVNGVSRLHGEVSRGMWQRVYPGIDSCEIPIEHVTNGVHAASWLGDIMKHLFERRLPPSETGDTAAFNMWEKIEEIPDEELWDIHLHQKKNALAFIKEKLDAQLSHNHINTSERSKVLSLIDPKTLTIGFARRFATYKRGDLILRNLDKLDEIVNDPEKPVQLIFAGKAHPADQGGKGIIKHIHEVSMDERFKGKIFFLENYDINIARQLVQGVDVWLNNPIRPQEASGTSGMKAALNGILNLSIPDGWWDEIGVSDCGWDIGKGEHYDDPEARDHIESELIYGILKRDVIRAYYNRDQENIPHEWLKMMKSAIKNLGASFNSHKMLKQYVERYYSRILELSSIFKADDGKELTNIAAWRKKLQENWEKVQVISINDPQKKAVKKGTKMEITAEVAIGYLLPENLTVECYHGHVSNNHTLTNTERVQLVFRQKKENGLCVYSGKIFCHMGGKWGYTVRVLPGHSNLAGEIIPGYMKWY